MNAIDMLKTDHKVIRQIFARFDKLQKDDHAGQKKVVHDLVQSLHAHAAVEEGHFYPAVAKAEAEPRHEVDAASEEHDHMDKMVDELAAMAPTDAGYRDRFVTLRDELLTHMREEEREMFPAAKDALGSSKLDALGNEMAKQKRDDAASQQH